MEAKPSTKIESSLGRTMIVDDYDLARTGLRNILLDKPSIEVVGEASNGQEAVAICARVLQATAYSL